MSCKITFESIIKFLQYDLLLKLETSSIHVEFYSFKQFLFHNFMLYRAENISVFVEGRNFKI